MFGTLRKGRKLARRKCDLDSPQPQAQSCLAAGVTISLARASRPDAAGEVGRDPAVPTGHRARVSSLSSPGSCTIAIGGPPG